jgi:transcriptional activator HAC1
MGPTTTHTNYQPTSTVRIIYAQYLIPLLTSLRKRAKTEAEKEQRRIERVIRNRLAAHSSRERKRKEVEKLEDQKSLVERENEKLREQVILYASKNAELLQKVRALEAELGRPSNEKDIKQEYIFPPSPPHSNSSLDCEDSGRSVSPSDSDIQDFVSSTDMTQHPAEML